MKQLERYREYFYLVLLGICFFPGVLKFSSVFFTDLRYQELVFLPGKNSGSARACALGICVLFLAGLWELCRRNNRTPEEFLTANLPLMGIGLLWILPPGFFLLCLSIFLCAWSCGRTFSLCRFQEKKLENPQAVLILTGIIFLYALLGAWQQCRSLDTLAMSWFDWGHFYECLNNFFHGKPFYLNLDGGSFLGSRFTPSLILLLPVVAVKSVPLFFFTGSLLVASGAWFVYLISREYKASPLEALLWGIWYLLIPGVGNMNLPLIDGPHEVFLLFPLLLGCFWCRITHRSKTFWILFFLALGVRETVGIFFAGYGFLLLLKNEKKVRKTGAFLLVFSLVYVILTLKVFMPLFDPPVSGTYAHVKFYSHLGKNMLEIALSPLLKPQVFFPALFNSHTLLFWITLFLPFAVLLLPGWILLLPMLPEFVMVSVDRRFDTQTVVRHYQTGILLVLIIAALYGCGKWRSGAVSHRLGKLFCGLKNSHPFWGICGMTWCSTLLCFFFFVQYPGLPASDPQRRTNSGGIPVWEDVTPAMERIKALLPPGVSVTAGARLASLLIPRNDLHLRFDCNEKALQDYVLIENFFSFYFPEDKLSRYLLQSPNWELLHQEFVDERSIQLFKRSAKKLEKKVPVLKLSERSWQRAGEIIPTPVQDLELRGMPIAPGKLRFGVRIKAPRSNDAGFRVELGFADQTHLKYFTSFCNGRYPADLAAVGDVFFFIVDFPAGKRLTRCRIDVIELKSAPAPQ